MEELYRTGGEGITHSGRFMTVIRRACEQTGRRVVVLIDEYDKPLLRSFDSQGTVSIYRCLVLRRMVVSCEVRTRQEQEL